VNSIPVENINFSTGISFNPDAGSELANLSFRTEWIW